MDRSKKIYGRAFECYSKGDFQKAEELCDKSIRLNDRDSASYNLKGLLNYLKGDLTEAQRAWELNIKLNDDMVSKKYLSSVAEDKARWKKYIAAEKLINDMKVRDAVDMLMQCSDSDFNALNVNVALGRCFVKLGEYQQALEHMERALKIDKNNEDARKLKKVISDFGSAGCKGGNIKNGLMVTFTTILVISAAFAGYAAIRNHGKHVVVNKAETAKGLAQGSTEQNNVGKSPVKKEVFPADDCKKAMEQKNYDELISIYEKWKDANLDANEKMLVNSGFDQLRNEGVRFFYNRGLTDFNEKKYESAIKSFEKADEAGKGSYLHPHVLYFLGSSYKCLGNVEKALCYYSSYDEQYSNGNYEEGVLYYLATTYESLDKDKSKKYAMKLRDNFANSMYNNSNINKILKN